MNNLLLERLWKEALAEEPYPDPRFPPSPYYRFMRILAANLKPSLSVELGVCGGGGCFHLAKGWPEGKVVGVDIAYDYPENTNFIISHCPNFEFFHSDSVFAAEFIYQYYGKIDIIFHDSVHTFDFTRREFEAYLPYLSDKAIVLFDDLFRPEMEGFWEWLPGQKMRMDTLHDGAESGGGFGAVWGLDND